MFCQLLVIFWPVLSGSTKHHLVFFGVMTGFTPSNFYTMEPVIPATEVKTYNRLVSYNGLTLSKCLMQPMNLYETRSLMSPNNEHSNFSNALSSCQHSDCPSRHQNEKMLFQCTIFTNPSHTVSILSLRRD